MGVTLPFKRKKKIALVVRNLISKVDLKIIF